MTAKFIPGTEGDPREPFFSPDGRWIGYWSVTDYKLKKIAIGGGASVALCDAAPALTGASWSVDDTIVFGLWPKGILHVSAKGGVPESFIKGESLGAYGLPQILPDGKSVLFTLFQEPYRIMAKSLKLEKPWELFAGDSARYLSSGHIVYAVGNNLLAAPFDPERLEMSGGGIPVVEGVLRSGGALQYAISDSGTLAYIPGTTSGTAPGRTLVWVDRYGKEELLAAPANNYAYPKISPDGKQVALTISTAGNQDIWVWDLARKTLTRLTFDKSPDLASIWTHDGKGIIFLSNPENKSGIYWKAADGTGKDELMGSATDRFLIPFSLSGDGKTLINVETADGTNWDIGTLSLEGDHARKPLLKMAVQPQISPNGRWIAFTSGESGKNEVYVRPFPEVDNGKWQASGRAGGYLRIRIAVCG